MRLFPGEADKKAKQTRFWVNSEKDGMSSLLVTEAPETIDRRLASDFPLYKLKQFGSEILNKLMDREDL